MLLPYVLANCIILSCKRQDWMHIAATAARRTIIGYPSAQFTSQGAPRQCTQTPGWFQVEMQGYLGRQYVEGSLCDKMPAIMRKDVEKLLDENASLKLTPQRFTRKEQEARAAQTAQVQANGAGSPGSPADGAAKPAGTATEARPF